MPVAWLKEPSNSARVDRSFYAMQGSRSGAGVWAGMSDSAWGGHSPALPDKRVYRTPGQ